MPTAPLPENPTEVPDLPAGIGGTDPQAPAAYTPADVAAAKELLTGADDREPQLVVALTDEQLAALDGYARPQFVALPWLEEHREQQAFAAGVALRTLIAAEQVLVAVDPETGARSWRAAPDLAACLVLRRTAAVFTTAERTVPTDSGPQVHRLHIYAHPSGVLEEEVTASGIHRFTALGPQLAAERLAAFVDPLQAPAAQTQSAQVSAAQLAAHPLAQCLASARALTVLTRVTTADGAVQQLSTYATPEGLMSVEAIDPAAADPMLEIRTLTPADLRALTTVLTASGTPDA